MALRIRLPWLLFRHGDQTRRGKYRDIAAFRARSALVRVRDGLAGWLGRQDSSLCVSESDLTPAFRNQIPAVDHGLRLSLGTRSGTTSSNRDARVRLLPPRAESLGEFPIRRCRGSNPLANICATFPRIIGTRPVSIAHGAAVLGLRAEARSECTAGIKSPRAWERSAR
jgi:hypothetical protein